MAPDFATEVQDKNCTNSKCSIMSILYHWKRLEVYFHMQQPAHPLKLFAELCLFWWRLFQSHVVQIGPIWLPTSRWILYHSIRFYPMYYTWMECLSSLLSYAKGVMPIFMRTVREQCSLDWSDLSEVVQTGPIWPAREMFQLMYFWIGPISKASGPARRDVPSINITCAPGGNPNHELNSEK